MSQANLGNSLFIYYFFTVLGLQLQVAVFLYLWFSLLVAVFSTCGDLGLLFVVVFLYVLQFFSTCGFLYLWWFSRLVATWGYFSLWYTSFSLQRLLIVQPRF